MNTSLKAMGDQMLDDGSYKAEMEAQMTLMRERFDMLKTKYVKQSKKTRELQVRMLQLTQTQQNNERSHSGHAVDVPSERGTVAIDSERNIDATRVASSEMNNVQARQLVNHTDNIERVPNEVLERIESLQDTRRRLYTAPSSQNRRPLPPEIPVPAEVLEAQRLTDEHRTEL